MGYCIEQLVIDEFHCCLSLGGSSGELLGQPIAQHERHVLKKQGGDRTRLVNPRPQRWPPAGCPPSPFLTTHEFTHSYGRRASCLPCVRVNAMR